MQMILASVLYITRYQKSLEKHQLNRSSHLKNGGQKMGDNWKITEIIVFGVLPCASTIMKHFTMY